MFSSGQVHTFANNNTADTLSVNHVTSASGAATDYFTLVYAWQRYSAATNNSTGTRHSIIRLTTSGTATTQTTEKCNTRSPAPLYTCRRTFTVAPGASGNSLVILNWDQRVTTLFTAWQYWYAPRPNAGIAQINTERVSIRASALPTTSARSYTGNMTLVSFHDRTLHRHRRLRRANRGMLTTFFTTGTFGPSDINQALSSPKAPSIVSAYQAIIAHHIRKPRNIGPLFGRDGAAPTDVSRELTILGVGQ